MFLGLFQFTIHQKQPQQQLTQLASKESFLKWETFSLQNKMSGLQIL
jgi:hypothetical protein